MVATRGWFLSLLFFFIAHSSTHGECVDPPDGLKAWWHGDGAPTDLVTGSAATLQNGAVFSTGKVNQAFDLTATNSHVPLPADPAILGLSQGTIEMWLRISDLNANTARVFGVAKAGVAFPSSPQWAIDYRTPGQIQVTGPGYTTLTQIASPQKIDDNDWHHLAVVVDVVGLIKVYIDGVDQSLDGNPNGGFIGSAAGADNLKIGAIERDVIFADGSKSIDEFSIYDRALSAAEVQAIFAAGADGKCKPGQECPDLVLRNAIQHAISQVQSLSLAPTTPPQDVPALNQIVPMLRQAKSLNAAGDLSNTMVCLQAVVENLNPLAGSLPVLDIETSLATASEKRLLASIADVAEVVGADNQHLRIAADLMATGKIELDASHAVTAVQYFKAAHDYIWTAAVYGVN